MLAIPFRAGFPLLAVCLTAAPGAQSQVITNADASAVLTFREDAQRGLVIESLGDDQSPQAIQFLAADVWQLEFHRGPQCILIGPSQLAEYDLRFDVVDGKVTVEWDDAESPLLPGETFTVEVEFEVDESSGEFDGKIRVSTETPASELHRVRFPRLEAVAPGLPATTRLAAPVLHGVLLPNPVNNVTLVGPAKLNAFLPPCNAFTLVEPGNLSMQWWSLYDDVDPEGVQLYFGTGDTLGYRKEWIAEPVTGGNALRLILRHVPENNHLADGDYAQPYPFVMRIVRGDWYDAAQHYRDWALDQPWTAQGPMAENPQFSSLMRATKALGVTQPGGNGPDDPDTFCPQDANFSDFQYWAPETASTRAALDIDAVTPRIFGWDFNSFGRDVGDWFPIRSEFISAAGMVRAQGGDFSAYFSSLVYSSRIPSYFSSYVPDSVNGGNYGSVEPWGIVTDAGARKLDPRQICPVQPAIVPMLEICQATQFAADYSAYVARRLYDESGTRGIYLDVLSSADAQLCYDPAHGHPLGGGAYSTQGMQHVFETVRQTMRDDPTAPVTGYFQQSEGAGEYFLPWLDGTQPALTWTRTQTFCDLFTGQCPKNGTDFLVIPSYNTVYNEYQLTGATLQLAAPRTLIGPLGIPILLDPFFMITLRNIATAHAALGYEPFAGSILSSNLMADNANPALFPSYFLLIDAVRRYFDVLELADVRSFTVEGRRLRDPEVVRGGPAESPLPAFPFDAAPIGHNWLKDGRLQPVVYGSLHSNRPGSKSDAVLDELGLLLLNWTDPADAFLLGAGNVGDQLVKARFDPAPHAPGATEYAAYLVTAGGELFLEDGPITGPIETTLVVPARSAVFVRYQLSAGSGSE